ncbi:hypothetical protein HMPREF9622_02889 [Cutibacterium modestum HL037PA3]|uniref:hypothetical protein n=1 Tax=Cutibacterium modestum TaxID=2559073 RepID=UPI0001F097E9|nr:hypothetical protein [Cutibacterium modestum]EFT14122.1 hypothetical protein HMPREF9622_02889 [Cutibacterium modestum HL037PA3]
MTTGALLSRIATASVGRGLGQITRWVEEPLVVGLRSTDKAERMSGDARGGRGVHLGPYHPWP